MVTEVRRLEALAACELLDTAPHPAFDCVVGAAALGLHVPVAAISLMDADRQWFKASVGIEARETSRAVALCERTIAGFEPVVIADARADADLRDNPLVTGAPYLRAYAGAPLIDPEGLALGTLCVMDTRPRRFTAADILLLGYLRDAAMTAIAAHRQGLALNKARRILNNLEAAA